MFWFWGPAYSENTCIVADLSVSGDPEQHLETHLPVDLRTSIDALGKALHTSRFRAHVISDFTGCFSHRYES